MGVVLLLPCCEGCIRITIVEGAAALWHLYVGAGTMRDMDPHFGNFTPEMEIGAPAPGQKNVHA